MSVDTNENKKRISVFAIVIGTAIVTFGLTAILVSVFRHKTEEKNPYLRLVEVKQATTDAIPWSQNWPKEYDQYIKTAEASRTNFGGGDANPAQKADMFPFLTRMFAGYAFSIDYRDRRGHAYMLLDQEQTRRVTERPQPGACLHCHASLIPTLVRLGGGDVAKDSEEGYDEKIVREGFVKLAKMSYKDAHEEVVQTGSLTPVAGKGDEFKLVKGAHPVSCTDCHNAKTMRLQISRPGFVDGIRALKATQGIKNFNVNKDATRAEMRSFVCAQCHVEYYCGPKVTLFFPWDKGVKAEEIEAQYDSFKFPDGKRFFDWQHAETGAEMLKAQHPEFELWSQGIHAKSGVACADCHMPYVRQGAMKVSDHHVRSPLLMVNQSCQQCHNVDANELKNRVDVIQSRNLALLNRSGQALLDFLDTFKQIRAPFDLKNKMVADKMAEEKLAKDEAYAKMSAEDKAKKLEDAKKASLNALWLENINKTPELKVIAELHRKAQWRLDFVAAENSMGFHAPQEAARILGESLDYFRQAQVEAARLLPPGAKVIINQSPTFGKK